MAGGRLDGQIELEASWREPSRALSALLQRRIGGKAVLHVDWTAPFRKVRGVSTVRTIVPAFEGLGSINELIAQRRQLT
jgi:hypothetical protein